MIRAYLSGTNLATLIKAATQLNKRLSWMLAHWAGQVRIPAITPQLEYHYAELSAAAERKRLTGSTVDRSQT